jgi:hypothetical protein
MADKRGRDSGRRAGTKDRPSPLASKMMQEIDARGRRPPDHEFGVRSSDLGSFLPEATYRAVPIVWFASAMMLQFFALAFLLSLPVIGIAIVALSAMVSVIVRFWIFRRGMARSSRAWKIATDAALLLNWGWLSAIAILR